MRFYDFAGKGNETDCMGRLTETIWMRSAGTAHPRAWKTPEDVQPDLLLRLRVPHIDGDICKAPASYALKGATALSEVALAISVPAKLTVTEPGAAGRGVLRNSLVEGMRTILQMASERIEFLQSDASVQKGNKGSVPASTDLLDALREQNPLPSSCPLFARKFDAATAQAVSHTYSKSILT